MRATQKGTGDLFAVIALLHWGLAGGPKKVGPTRPVYLLPLALATIATIAATPKGQGALALAPFGTARPSHPPDELRLPYGAEPPTTDPSQANDSVASDFVELLFAGLVRLVGPDLTVMPELAERWSIDPDGRHYRFFLRPSRWSDGTPITAQDFVFSLQRTVDPSVAAANGQLLAPILHAAAIARGELPPASLGVTAIDAKTLDIELAAPAPYFLQLCAHPAMRPVPAHRLAVETSWPRPEALVTSGPFVVKRWRFRRDVELVANPCHFNAHRQGVAKILQIFVARPDTGMALYQDGELDLSPSPVPLAWLPRAKQASDFRTTAQLASDFYWLNTERPPLNDVRVREALNLAIDRRQLIAAVLPHSEPAASLVPPALGGEPFRAAHFDPARARALLAAAGFAGGHGLRTLTLLFNAHEVHRRLAEAVQAMWRKHLGVEVELGQREWQVYLSEVAERRFDIARLGWVADFADARSFLFDVLGPTSRQNHSGWQDPVFSALLAASDAAADGVARRALLKQAEQRALAAVPLLPLSFGRRSQLVAPYVQDLEINALGHMDLGRVRLPARGAALGGG